MLNRDNIIATLAKEHQILLSKDDPIVSFLLVHQIVLDSYSQSFSEDFESNMQQLVTALNEAQNNYTTKSKELANEIIGTSITKITDAEQNLIKKLAEYKYKDDAVSNSKIKAQTVWLYILAGLLSVNILLSLANILVGVLK